MKFNEKTIDECLDYLRDVIKERSEQYVDSASKSKVFDSQAEALLWMASNQRLNGEYMNVNGSHLVVWVYIYEYNGQPVDLVSLRETIDYLKDDINEINKDGRFKVTFDITIEENE